MIESNMNHLTSSGYDEVFGGESTWDASVHQTQNLNPQTLNPETGRLEMKPGQGGWQEGTGSELWSGMPFSEPAPMTFVSKQHKAEPAWELLRAANAAYKEREAEQRRNLSSFSGLHEIVHLGTYRMISQLLRVRTGHCSRDNHCCSEMGQGS